MAGNKKAAPDGDRAASKANHDSFKPTAKPQPLPGAWRDGLAATLRFRIHMTPIWDLSSRRRRRILARDLEKELRPQKRAAKGSKA